MINYKVITGLLKELMPNVTVVKAHGKARPKKPYIAWYSVSSLNNGKQQPLYYNIDNFVEKQTQNKTENIQIDFYSDTEQQGQDDPNYKTANDLADELVLKLNTYKSLKYQFDNDLGVQSWTDLTPQTYFLGDKNELRATIEVKLNNNAEYSESIPTVNTDAITINTTYEGI